MVLASQTQHGMWITEVMHGTGYSMPFAMWFDGPLDNPALLAACRQVIARHPALSCAFSEQDGELHLISAPNPPTVELALWSDALIEKEIARPFDLSRGPLARFTLASVSPTRHLLLFVGHHLVFDGISKDLLVRDLAEAYSGATLSPRPMPYGEASRTPPEAVAYWEKRWRESPTVVIGGRTVTPRPGAVETVELTLTLPNTSGARGDISRFEVFLAATHGLLFRYGNADVAVAVALSTRTADNRDDIGLFATELPIYSSPDPGQTLEDLARHLGTELRSLNPFRGVPVARAVGGIKPRAALAPISVSYRQRGQVPIFSDLDFRADWQLPGTTVRTALNLLAVDTGDTVHLSLQFNPEVLTRPEVHQFADDLRAILTPNTRLGAPGSSPSTATPEPETTAKPSGSVDPELVEQVRQIWMEVLRLDELALDEDLYDLGGHSLTITQIGARIRKRLGVDVPFDVFLDDPTVTGVATAVSELRA